MANNIKNWNVDPDKNDKESPYGWKEDMAPSDVNNTARQEMADLKDAYVSQPWFSVGTPTISVLAAGRETVAVIPDDETDTNYAKYFTEGRAVRIAENEGSEKYKLIVTSASYNQNAGESRVTLAGWGETPQLEDASPAELVRFFRGLSTFHFMEIGLEPDAVPSGPNLLGCVLPFTANVGQLRFGFGLADGTTFNPDLYVELAKLYLVSGEVGGSGSTYLHGQEYNAAAGKNWPKKPDVRGYFPRFAGLTGRYDVGREVGSTQGYATAADDLYLSAYNGTGTLKRVTDTTVLAGNTFAAGATRELWAPASLADTNNMSIKSTATETRPVNIALPGILVMYGGYGRAGTITPEQVISITNQAAQEYIDEKWVTINQATTTDNGLVRLATEEEAAAGIEDRAVLTPYSAQFAIASKLGDYYTKDEADTAIDTALVPLEADITTIQNTKASNESVAQVNQELMDVVSEVNELIVEMDDRYTKSEVDALVGGGAATTSQTVNVAPTAWDSSTKSVTLADYADSNDIFWVAPAGTVENTKAYAEAGCVANRDAADAKLKLYCETIPDVELVVELVHMDIA